MAVFEGVFLFLEGFLSECVRVHARGRVWATRESSVDEYTHGAECGHPERAVCTSTRTGQSVGKREQCVRVQREQCVRVHARFRVWATQRERAGRIDYYYYRTRTSVDLSHKLYLYNGQMKVLL
jgi:hypothetical protein